MLCQDCPEKPTCTELCPEAEEYVSQDHVSLHKQSPTIGNDTELFNDEDVVWDYQKDGYDSIELKILIIQLSLEGKSIREIAYHLPCSHVYIHKVLTKFKTNPLKLLNK